MLELKNISKSYKQHRVLDDVNLTVNDGEMVALLGPSGSGKTTILRLIAGFLENDSGAILVDGVDIASIPSYKRNIGVVFQDYALFPHMTVEQNVAFGLKMHKVGSAEIKERLDAALRLVGLEDYKSRYPSQLSGGQQQRVAIARVVAIRAKVMLLDEPLSNLDAKLRRQVRVELRELQQKLDITTLIVTHDQEEAMTMGDRIAILNDGYIQQIGDGMQLYKKPVNRFVAGFLGTPSINFLPLTVAPGIARLSKIDIGLSELESGLGITLEPNEYELGVRPEDFSIVPDSPIKSKVKLVERLGAETLVYFEIDNRVCCCRANMGNIPTQDDEISLSIDYTSTPVFDSKSGICLNNR
ncbi:MAG: Spermidine/putrescine import ATP-binding protein PotA [Firmicutes bacterium ADurb.Bin182]|nr:MAG: Spermidine/putrescine import ATP-binding protein PotA [Firmicutes bacterium ADurb.Bin182]